MDNVTSSTTKSPELLEAQRKILLGDAVDILTKEDLVAVIGAFGWSGQRGARIVGVMKELLKHKR